MKKRYKSAEQKKALLEHQAWLKARGIRTPRKKRYMRGVKPDSLSDDIVRNVPPTSDTIAVAFDRHAQDKLDASYRAAVAEKAKTVAQSYNKGPFQPQTSKDCFESRRRS
jgi:hypothetical protein